MTKHHPTLIVLAVVTLIIMLASLITILIGFSYTVLSGFIFITDNSETAQLYFLTGIGLIALGYIVNVLLAFGLTRKWSWRPTMKFEFRAVPKQKKK